MVPRLALFSLVVFTSALSVAAEGFSLKVTCACQWTCVVGSPLAHYTGPERVSDVSEISLTTTLTNMGENAVTLVNDPRSALSSRQTETFAVTHENGARPAFTGMRVKYALDRAAKDPQSRTTLQPGQSAAVTHTLAGAYNFTTSGAGTYQIAPSTLFHVVSAAGTPEPVYASLENSHSVIIEGTGRLAVPRNRKRATVMRRGTVLKRASFSSCSSSEESQVNTATSGAASYVAVALSYLAAHTASTTRFTTWFGSYTSTHHTTITNHYTSLTSSGSYTGWTYDCACDDGDDNTYAYTFPDVYGEIFLCPVFWEAPQTGTDSKAGTLVHESTHFDKTAATQDYAYGQSACESLARSVSAEAIENADSHEYFAENSPALS